MNKSDQWVVINVVAMLLLYIAVWLIGYRTHKLNLFTAAVNLLTGSFIIIYWVVKQLRITQHHFELREFMALGLEAILIGCAIYTIIAGQKINWLKVTQYVFFGIHFTILIAALIFLLTFKMNKLM
jgi:hypothetical protein